MVEYFFRAYSGIGEGMTDCTYIINELYLNVTFKFLIKKTIWSVKCR